MKLHIRGPRNDVMLCYDYLIFSSHFHSPQGMLAMWDRLSRSLRTIIRTFTSTHHDSFRYYLDGTLCDYDNSY